MPTVAETLSEAKARHHAGDLPSAQQLYRQVIQADAANAEAHFLLGTACQAVNETDEALACLTRAVQLKPDDAQAHNHLGMVRAQQGKLDEAIASFERACRLCPESGEMANNLRQALAVRDHARAGILAREGKWIEAEALYRRALEQVSNYVAAHGNLGNLLSQQGKVEEAAACYAAVLALDPNRAEAHYDLGVVRQQQGRIEEAIGHFRRALQLRPHFPHALLNLGSLLAGQDQFDEAVDCFAAAVALEPNFAEAHNQWGVALLNRDRLHEAFECFRRAAALNPEMAEAHNNLGVVAGRLEKPQEAIASYRRALALQPGYVDAINNLGRQLERLGLLEEADACSRRAIELQGDSSEAHLILGRVLLRLGKTDEALACFGRCLETRPQFPSAHSSALLALQYQPGATWSQLAAAHRQFDQWHAAPLRVTWRPHPNRPDPERKLRLGFVSPDLCFHPVGYFLVRVLENLDRSQVEIWCYSGVPLADAMTDRLRATSTNWREIRALGDQALAEQIRADRIDILFDLAGHTADNRLLAFARKPAPIAITWLGYMGTTGLGAIDYLLADPFLVPEAAEPYLAEKVLRMPNGFACYDPPSDAPAVSSLPALDRGHVTFGSFNNPLKITPDVVDLWANILRQVGASRLVLKYRGLDAPEVARHFARLFAERGIDASRLELLGESNRVDYLREYWRIDVALDTFPYSGGMTTCDALWMGVPVITFPGETFASRHSLSHLSNVGLTETITSGPAEYAGLAVALAADLPRLAGIHAGLRPQMAASPLCDGPRFSQNLLQLLRGVWRTWRPEQATAGQP